MSGFGLPPHQHISGGNYGAAGFGSASSPGSSSFTFGSVQPVAGSSSFGSGFGQSQPSTPAQFGSAVPNAAFGSSPNVVTANKHSQLSSAGNCGSSGQGQGFLAPAGLQTQSQSQPFSSPIQNNPFQRTSTGNGDPPMTFGTSSNVVSQRNDQPGFSSNGSGWKPSPSGFGSNPFGNSSVRSSQSSPGLQGRPDNEHTMERSSGPSASSRGLSTAQAQQKSTNEESAMTESVVPDLSHDNKDDLRLKANREEKKRLQAIIDEKKRKLLERKQKRSQPGDSSLNPAASAFVPGKSSGKSSQSDLAQRNAVRFGNQAPELKSRASLENRSKDNRKDLEKAAALVGTCPFMCPDDELQRRERENDIQQLELPVPGKLHPKNWSIRDTAIKRFRRSAADYKLDVPEWVRPPDVLERVCGYIEEWIMVSGQWRVRDIPFFHIWFCLIHARTGIDKVRIPASRKIKPRQRWRSINLYGTEQG
jgi:hypothetical protein